ncbi:MAG: tRNA (N(6)-L-threonylcarbamoyladenosine(37)-C(2))-methylthiotransferase MtaB [Lachnospiraceae bacterium]|nr:tRNA (N(6)-L-threonylcarbamoyladenosine(37)-C(2))-methylthiotransferase MtaB [Lachnospiraceae bacterium]
MKKRAALHNLGCKVNAYETEAMQQQLEQAGYEIVPFEPGADVYVINTCSVTNIADRKSRQMLHKAKKMNPDAVIVAAGCYVQTANDRTGLDVDADILIGNNKKKDLADILREFEKKRTEKMVTERELLDINHTKEYEALSLSGTEEHTRAYIKVQDGCNQFCSYCIIPYARGRVRSRDLEDVRREISRLADSGVKEVVLTGIHLSSYGIERGSSLIELLEEVQKAEGISRIRLGSLEPGIVTEEFAGRLSKLTKICPHFHLSLQSGSDSVLRRMNRRYNTAEYLAHCEILRRYFENPALTTDVIVGFPGETEAEFEETVAFLKTVNFYETHIFKYSKRKGTKAAEMPDQITEAVKGQRSDVLLELNRKNKGLYEESRLGRKCEILLEEKSEIAGNTCFTGYTREYIKAAVLAEGHGTNEIITGRLVKDGDGNIFIVRD